MRDSKVRLLLLWKVSFVPHTHELHTYIYTYAHACTHTNMLTQRGQVGTRVRAGERQEQAAPKAGEERQKEIDR